MSWLVVLVRALQSAEQPLLEAARTGDMETLRALLDEGADRGELFLWALDRNDGSTKCKAFLSGGDRRERKQ